MYSQVIGIVSNIFNFRKMQDHATPYLLGKFLRNRDPSVLVTDRTAKEWLELHGGIRATKRTESAIHLEPSWGGCIRSDCAEDIAADGLSYWMLANHNVAVWKRACQTWLDRD
ncbi:hypothetical protein N9L19_00530 [bacterium]|nr:hypothetical protein [bacterium]